MDGFAQNRCRRPVRVPISAGRLGQAHRFVALRYEKKKEAAAAEKPQQYQLFDTVVSVSSVMVFRST